MEPRSVKQVAAQQRPSRSPPRTHATPTSLRLEDAITHRGRSLVEICGCIKSFPLDQRSNPTRHRRRRATPSDWRTKKSPLHKELQLRCGCQPARWRMSGHGRHRHTTRTHTPPPTMTKTSWLGPDTASNPCIVEPHSLHPRDFRLAPRRPFHTPSTKRGITPTHVPSRLHPESPRSANQNPPTPLRHAMLVFNFVNILSTSSPRTTTHAHVPPEATSAPYVVITWHPHDRMEKVFTIHISA